MQITLKFNDDNTKTFVADVRARAVREAMTLQKEVNFENMSVEDLDKLVNFTCNVYGKKFTLDELYDGLESDKLIPTLFEVVESVINGVTEKLDTFPTK